MSTVDDVVLRARQIVATIPKYARLDRQREWANWVLRGDMDFTTDVQIAIETIRAVTPSFQSRVTNWVQTCFPATVWTDLIERGDRLLEEVFELLQSGKYPRERIRALEAYVYGREAGEQSQEVGGVMVTLAAYCAAFNINMHAAGECELTRISAADVMEKIRAKQAAKPTGSALPIATDLDCIDPTTRKLVEDFHLPWQQS